MRLETLLKNRAFIESLAQAETSNSVRVARWVLQAKEAIGKFDVTRNELIKLKGTPKDNDPNQIEIKADSANFQAFVEEISEMVNEEVPLLSCKITKTDGYPFFDCVDNCVCAIELDLLTEEEDDVEKR